jgi:hypothetical protein
MRQPTMFPEKPIKEGGGEISVFLKGRHMLATK